MYLPKLKSAQRPVEVYCRRISSLDPRVCLLRFRHRAVNAKFGSSSDAKHMMLVELTLNTVLFLLLSGVCSAQTRRNVTVDSSSPRIRYSPTSSWRKIVGDLDAGGEHMMTQDPNAYALINSSFVSYWTMSVKWPYRVRTQHTVDGNNTFVIDLQDHTVPDVGAGSGSKASSIVAQYIGSSELRHTIRISVPPGERYAVIDRLIFETEDGSSSAPLTRSSTQMPMSAQTSASVRPTLSTNITTTTPTAPPSSGESSAVDKERKLTLILGILGPFLTLFCVLLFVYLFYRRRTKTKRLEVEDVPPLPSMTYDTTNNSIRVLRPSGASHFTISDMTHTVIGPYLPYTPPRQGLCQSLSTHPSSPPISPDRTSTHRPQAF